MNLKKTLTPEEAKEKAIDEILAGLQQSYNQCLEQINKDLIEYEKLKLQHDVLSNVEDEQLYKKEIDKLEHELEKLQIILPKLEKDINKITN